MRASVYVEMLKRTGLAVVLTLYFCPPASATQCTAKHLAQHVLGAPRSQLPRDGGIVVANTSVAGTAPTSAAPAWALQINGHSANIAPTTLAPGLVVYRAGAAAKRIAVFEGKTGRAGATVTDSYATPLNAPQPSSVVYAANPEFVGVKMTVTLATAAPADAIALIVYDARSRARTWGAVTAGATTVIVYNDELCRPVPAGTIEPSAGEKITLAWVDAAGGVSELSAPLVVTQ